MDLSALIFVALAVAWAVYLIPKALKHHDEVVRSRSVEKFSHTMRILARREPVDRRNARLVVAPIRARLRPPVETKAHAPVEPVATVTTEVRREVTTSVSARRTPPATERASARRAAKRRRNVLALIGLANAVVIGLAAAAVITWPWVAIPAGVLLAWLVACRVSVRAERRQRDARAAIEIGYPPLIEDDDLDLTGEMPVTPPQPRSPAAPVAPSEDAPVEAPAVVARPDRRARPGWLGHGPHDAPDLRQQARRPASYGLDDRPRLHGRLVERPQRRGLRPRPLRREVRQERSRRRRRPPRQRRLRLLLAS